MKSRNKSIPENGSNSCDLCEYKSKSKGGLQGHIESNHGNVIYPCEQCEYIAKQKEHLNSFSIEDVYKRLFISLCTDRISGEGDHGRLYMSMVSWRS